MAEQLETSLSPGTAIHDSINEALGIPNLAFSKVLMLMIEFTFEVFDAIEADDAKDTLPTLGLAIVREENLENNIGI